jgi:hypothetical protein
MKLTGSLESNLQAAILGVRRHRGQSVYPETMSFWNELVAYAWRYVGSASTPDTKIVTHLVQELEREIAARLG